MSGKIIAFDLDDVLCFRPEEFTEKLEGVQRYHYCQPLPKMIEKCNALYDKGYYIKIFTARGMTIFEGDIERIYKELYILTESQLIRWGVKYHELILGKPHYDLFIDDKAINVFDINDLGGIEEGLKRYEEIVHRARTGWLKAFPWQKLGKIGQ